MRLRHTVLAVGSASLLFLFLLYIFVSGQQYLQKSNSIIVRITQTTSVPFDIIVSASETDVVAKLMRDSGGYAPVESSIVDKLLRGVCSEKGQNKQDLPPMVLDVGANQGYFTLLAAAHGCRVRAYEPNKHLVELLRASLILNGFSNRVNIVNAGVGAEKGSLRYIVNDEDTGLSRVVGDSPATSHLPIVPIVSLQDEVTEDIALVKVDTEGFEQYVLEGLLPACQNFRIANIIIEIKRAGQRKTLDRLWSCVEATGAKGIAKPVRRAMYFREWYGVSELRTFQSGGGHVKSSKGMFGRQTPHGYFSRQESPVDFGFEDVWFSLDKDWENI